MTEAKNKKRLVIKIIIPLLILIIGFAGFNMMGKLKKAPQRQRPPQQGVLVDVITLEAKNHLVKVHATGTVQAEQEISLVPEISGKVSWISPQLVSGGFFKKGETLLQIETSDFQLAIEMARAEIAQVQVALATERERAKVALAEWERIDIPDKGTPGPLVTREIQMQQQLANLAAAEANLQLAELNLRRTELKAPFDGRIREEQVDLGQYLRSGTSIGTFSGTDRAEIYIPLQVNELSWLKIPSATQKQGSLADIYLPGDKSSKWSGKVMRSLGEIDPTSRMATLVVMVEDPYQQNGVGKNSELQNGLFVDIEIHGEEIADIISIPRKALHTDNQVWIADSENHLNLRTVDILRREKQQILVKGGVLPGEKLVLTTLSGATEGILLRPVLLENPQ
ncbi:efflux RND transporter periplasmic adaptor subunit [uncultured Desulfuromusa sp.]|uniref:efflux RND transporter periplasmic adaptor subunit n=1 Tax=uncultured Desulfuromusa sp. TaxID=219183 RepID=UPI002AA8D61B|nr:efflux RND transporter periplasmic adaptor subunit [uncultured Desulfuromusa sp.]